MGPEDRAHTELTEVRALVSGLWKLAGEADGECNLEGFEVAMLMQAVLLRLDHALALLDSPRPTLVSDRDPAHH